ncbi:5-oxoprolinase/urea amidolyase family protein [Dechloromonas sp. TW-R-39-2]|uniref:5-oxoprolinase subunit C family protein n=1 Tax=Dechloromonas sp. TW-R-39-2 TaxID=2654218 RepID=UPI00193D2C51|nr:biotin-dependent carboxyltransferase family protein [Dechloromonas sp. TW-R-39-2]QRM18380.1 5-oxoprolinase/urea amidolyase family protein [Dechloromonas sp. TW-R-39-2]
MDGLIELIDGGLGNSIQDPGRRGYRHIGVAVSGTLDRPMAACANLLAGNHPDAASLEMRGIGPTLKVQHGPVRIAIAGQTRATLIRANGNTQPLTAWCSTTLDDGDVVKIGAIADGVAYLAVSGGIRVAPELGSRATYQRAAIGGINGRAVQTGDTLPCSQPMQRDLREWRAEPLRHDEGPIRVIPGPQDQHFSTTAWFDFLNGRFVATPEMDRMGMRLSGPKLGHITPEAADIVSDGVTPGAIQVPANGQPIILLADCQTVGGYPKIATVITADLPRLAHWQPGQEVRFAAVDLPQASKLLAAQMQQLAAWQNSLQAFLPPGSLDESALYNLNLVSGMVRAEP